METEISQLLRRLFPSRGRSHLPGSCNSLRRTFLVHWHWLDRKTVKLGITTFSWLIPRLGVHGLESTDPIRQKRRKVGQELQASWRDKPTLYAHLVLKTHISKSKQGLKHTVYSDFSVAPPVVSVKALRISSLGALPSTWLLQQPAEELASAAALAKAAHEQCKGLAAQVRAAVFQICRLVNKGFFFRMFWV